MAKRERDVPILFYVTKEERDYIIQKKESLNIISLSAYLRKMAIDGYVKTLSDGTIELLRNYNHTTGGISRNINQLIKNMNSFGTIDNKDISEIKNLMEEVWELQRSILLKLTKN